ncbi:MAG: stage II sporulation protein R [Ruminiclostridium sp.]|nr:stage II sporulation protein R [Ruminiclostridium sp.]
MAGFKFSFTGIFFVVSAVLVLMISGFSAFATDCEETPDKVLRLHILANSDSEEDQKLKYELRDHMLLTFAEVFSGCENSDKAIEASKENRISMEQAANSFIRSKGYNYNVVCEIADTYFTTRKYENYTLPAGEYTAVRFLIGKAEGKNWWCVMFPPLCLPASGEFFTEQESKRIEQSKNIEVRFALFEIIGNIFGKSDDKSEEDTTARVPETPKIVREIFANKSPDRLSAWNLRFLF